VEPRDLRRAVAANIRSIAKRRRRTINALADFAGVSRAQMFNVLAARTGATVDWLAKVASALDVEPAALLAVSEAATSSAAAAAERRPAFTRVPTEVAAKQGAVPLVTLRAAAGPFGRGEQVEIDEWVVPNTRRKISSEMFVAQVEGDSMAPTIPGGAYCLFRHPVRGPLDGRVVLVAYRRFHDPETHARYAVKRFVSAKKTKTGGKVRLASFNPRFKPIEIATDDPQDVRVVAEFVEVLG
jgi:phage repressor protein C with HTH and peptisase S24 domain